MVQSILSIQIELLTYRCQHNIIMSYDICNFPTCSIYMGTNLCICTISVRWSNDWIFKSFFSSNNLIDQNNYKLLRFARIIFEKKNCLIL